ncbi:hypothetical protein GCM10023196_014020 [Actinoallomurus vinaceus]|uniref:Tat pathway signal sequence domain protein n=1 Tax=Actinoallomurus vinaceus TaxID=1080074 RepID=A0ABP8U5P2_9ACTN
MTVRQNEMLEDTLRRMADRTEAGEGLPERLAEQALRGASRRRAARIGVGAVAAVGGVAAVALMPIASGDGRATPVAARPRPVATGRAVLPANTAAQLAMVRACMVGDPNIPSPPRRPTPGAAADHGRTGPGTHVRDFRVLATYRDSRGQAVFLGSTVAHRVCNLDTSGRPSPSDRTPGQTAVNWWHFPAFTGPISLEDQAGGVLSTKEQSRSRAYAEGIEEHLAGCVTPDVARVTVTLPGGRAQDAAVSNGFFLWRAARTGASLAGAGQEKEVIVRAYDRGGRVLKTVTRRVDAAVLPR